MTHNAPGGGPEKRPAFMHKDGVTYFDRNVERSVFFVLTLIMLVLGALSRWGLL